jgi:hypothetical protein
MGGMQTKDGHSISQNSLENALNRTPKQEKYMLSVCYQYLTCCLMIFS